MSDNKRKKRFSQIKGAKQKSPKDQLVDEIRTLAQYHGLNQVYTTFLELTALCLSIETEPMTRSERTQRYEEIMKTLDEQATTAYARMTADLFMAVQMSMDEPYDILGAIFMELGLSNEWNGQFFTPDNICRMMAMLVGADHLPEKGCATINEPTCGSGAMVLGAVYAMKQKNQDYQHHSLFIAQDIDIRCVWMAYIRLWMYQIPAIVIHGDTLAMKEWSRWYTPFVTCVEQPEQDTVEETEAQSEREAV